jgi:glycosyltransferase involved in cell wall biosynthesis
MLTSVVVAPRERFTSLPLSLASLFETIPVDVPVVVVEGATPADTRAELHELARQRPFQLLFLPYMIKPNEARNRGIAEVSTEYVVIADNDIQYERGWLEALEEHAVAHDSDAVAPLICIGPPAATIVHHAGGILRASRANGNVEISEAHRLMDVPMADVASFPEARNNVCEFHCMMARRSLLEDMGGLDERLITREQVDFALRALVLEAKVTFAERAIVTYMARDAFDSIDLRYHLFRWSDRFVVESMDAFEATWGLSLDRDETRYAWTAKHRARAAETTYPRLRRLLGKDRFRRWVVARLEERVVTQELRARGELVPSVPADLPRERVEQTIGDLVEATERDMSYAA